MRAMVLASICILGLLFAPFAVTPAAAQSEAAVPEAGVAPGLRSPADGAVTTGLTDPPVGVPLLDWFGVAGASKYQVQISSSSGFATPLVSQETYATSYAALTDLADGVYFWRVRAYAGKEWGPYSDPWMFTKDWSAGGSLVPQLLTPVEGDRRDAFEPDDFTWTSVAGAATYKFEISLDPEFSSAAYSATTLTTRHTPTVRFESNTYHWRVIPYDRQGHAGTPSLVGSFVFDWDLAPQLLAPEPDVTLSFLPRFSWTAVKAARQYRLQISTQPDLSSSITTYLSDHTDYTPEQNLANDKDYYWRVQAVDYHGIAGPWSEIRRFRMQWYFQAQLLTPLNNAIHTSYPFFSWAPIPGAERYEIQIDESTSFASPIAYEKIYNVTTYAQPRWENVIIDGDYYWRVRGLDARGNASPWSTTRVFRPSYDNSPTQVYPLYYYVPDDENNPVHADRTVPWPLFVWDTAHRFDPATGLTAASEHYELAVDDDPAFGSPNFQVETTGLAAAPTATHPFHDLVDGKLYYWRVRAYRGGVLMGADTPWVARIDRRVRSVPASTELTPIYPPDGFEAVGAPPVLGWLPNPSGGPYEVEISRDEAFSLVLDQAVAGYPNYVPWQGRPAEMPFGSYWWRVRRQGDAAWSAPRRFNLSIDVIAGNPYDATPPATSILNASARYVPSLSYIASSTAEPGLGGFDLRALHVMLNRHYWPEHPVSINLNWVIAFQTAATASDSIVYGIYFDVDHVKGHGAASDPTGRTVAVHQQFLPEYALYLDGGAWLGPARAQFYRWNGAGWDPPQTLAAIGGDVWSDAGQGAVQVLLPYGAIGSADTDSTGSVALTVFSAEGNSQAGPLDSIPDQGAVLDRPAFVSDMLMPLYPFDTPLSNPSVQFDMPTVRWRMPLYDSVDGYQVEVARDAKFTQVVERWESYETKTWPYYGLIPAAFATKNAYEDNESYYWRVRIRHERYLDNSNFFDYGPWSPGMRFKLDSRQPADLSESTGSPADTTPTFSWKRVEGASGYKIQVDNDANFSSPVINVNIDGASYTPLDALADATYYWRVAMRRSNTVIGHWSEPRQFTKRSLPPSLTAPGDDAQIHDQPLFAWSALLAPAQLPRLAAPRYRLQVSADPNFSTPRTIDTSATSVTPPKGQGLADGAWYWRVAVIDANAKVGAYSTPRRLYKEYQPPTLIWPGQGASVSGIPSFRWLPYDGAAYYKVEIADNELFNRPVSVTTDNTRYTPTQNLTSASYYWRVRIVDADGNAGPFSVGRVRIGASLYLPLVSH